MPSVNATLYFALTAIFYGALSDCFIQTQWLGRIGLLFCNLQGRLVHGAWPSILALLCTYCCKVEADNALFYQMVSINFFCSLSYWWPFVCCLLVVKVMLSYRCMASDINSRYWKFLLCTFLQAINHELESLQWFLNFLGSILNPHINYHILLLIQSLAFDISSFASTGKSWTGTSFPNCSQVLECRLNSQ